MIKGITENSLSIMWNGEEKDGILVYGYWDGDVKNIDFPSNIWPKGIEVKNRKLFDYKNNRWTVLMWEIRIIAWPKAEDWHKVIQSALSSMIGNGALISWCGLEGGFADPPNLFNKNEMGCYVWAVQMKDSEFICKANLGQEFQTLSGSEMDKIYQQLQKNR